MAQIKWKQTDYMQLGRAVANFNKKRREIINEENKLYLPPEISYKELKGNILTRSELKRQMNSLKRFMKQGAEDLYTTKAGEKLTKWEKKNLDIERQIATKRLKKELAPYNVKDESGFTRAEMGNTEARNIVSQIKNLRKFENLKGTDFSRYRSRLHNIGRSDYSTKRAITFYENYKEEMKKYSDFDNYEKLEKFIETYNNPVVFYEKVSVNENSKDLTYQSDMYLTQQAFNSFLQDLGIEIEEDTIS